MNVVYPAWTKQKLTWRNLDRYHHGTRNTSGPLLGTSNKPTCLVWGALAMSLRLSRVIGAAPLRLTRERGGWRASVSHPIALYSCALVITIHTCYITSFISDLIFDSTTLIVVSIPTVALAALRLLDTVVLVTISVFTGPKRMTQMIEYLNIINNIYIQHSNGRKWQPAQKKTVYIVAGVLIILNVSFFLAFFMRCIMFTQKNGRSLLFILHVFGCFERVHAILLESQFLYVGLLAEAAFEKINDSLQYIVDIVEVQRPQELEKMKDMITDLTSSHGVACDVLNRVSNSFGKVVLLMLGSIFLELLIAMYFLSGLLRSPDVHTLSIVIYIVTLTCNFFNLIIITEPGHRIETQINQTKIILSNLMRRVMPDDTLATQLHFFFKQLCLDNASISTLGICTLTRPVILSMLGGITTYLVILLQFVSFDKSI